MAKEEKVGLGSALEIHHQDAILSFEGKVSSEIIASTIHRPGVEPETLIYLKDTPIENILNESSALAGFPINDIEIEDVQEKIKRSGFPIKVEAGISGEGGHFELELKSKEEIKSYRRVTIRYKK